MPKLSILFVLCLTYSLSFGFNFEQEVIKNKHLSSKEFIQQFSFKDYQLTYPIDDIITLETHRLYLNNHGINGNDFIEALINANINSVSLDFNSIDSIKYLLRLGEMFSHSNNYLPDSLMAFMVASDIIFETIADTLETLIKDKKVSLDDFDIKYLVQRLIDNQYSIALPPNNLEKLKKYIMEGRWDYIWHKFTTTYLKEFIIAICTSLSVLFFLMWRFVRYRKRKVAKKILPS